MVVNQKGNLSKTSKTWNKYWFCISVLT